ncbi:MAG: PQQ-dependent sugar dehydrogenase [Acidobacteria bacterium]|nr:PQQ-dependent sugar dehydrogenase [Acidobacteriota bacterium]
MTIGPSPRLIAFMFVSMLAVGHAQEGPAIGLPVPPLGMGPFEFETAEKQKIRVSVVTKGLSHPWSLVFLPDGNMLVTERPGRLRIIRNGVLDPTPIAGVPRVRTDGNGGLMDVALHPGFSDNRLVYFTYTKPVENGKGTPTLARGRLEGGALADVRDLLVPDAFDGNSGLNGRVVFGRDGMVYMSTGGNIGKVAQDPASLRGKILRLRDDGSVPPDNPFVGRAGYRPEIFTLGHRNTLALIVPRDGRRVEQRKRSPRRRRNQHHPARPQLRMADRELRTRLSRPARLRTSHARRDGVAPRGLDSFHCDLGHGRLLRRSLPSVEGQRVCRRDAGRPNPGHGPSRAHRVQRQDRGVAARIDARRAQAAHPGSSSGPRWVALSSDR